MRSSLPLQAGCIAAVAVVCLVMAACKPDEGHKPLPEALAALQSDNEVLYSHVPVEAWDNDSYYIFEPKAGQASTALIFYGGASCDVRSYAPMAREIARAGFMMVLVKMPEDWALQAPERAAVVMEAFPAITAWAIGVTWNSTSASMAASRTYTLAFPIKLITTS